MVVYQTNLPKVEGSIRNLIRHILNVPASQVGIDFDRSLQSPRLEYHLCHLSFAENMT